MKTSPRLVLPLWLIATFITTILPAAMLMLGVQTSHAANATWNLNPGSGDWNTAADWTPAAVPDGPADTATFVTSNHTAVSLSAPIEVSGITYNAGASAFTTTVPGFGALTLSGAGITNNSGITQTFVATEDIYGSIIFNNSATAGSSTSFTLGSNGGGVFFSDTSTAGSGVFTVNGPGQLFFSGTATAGNGIFTCNGTEGFSAYIQFSGSSTAGNSHFTLNGNGHQVLCFFYDTSTAGASLFTVNGGDSTSHGPGQLSFNGTATAGNATLNANGGSVGGSGSLINFIGDSTAGSATLIVNGGGLSGDGGGLLQFTNTSTAGGSTLIVNGGVGGGDDGTLQFTGDSTGGTARVEVLGNGTLDIGGHTVLGMTIGSLEGSGNVFVGANNLTVGSNNTARSFSGVIEDMGQSGASNGVFTKIGTGTLAFEGGASNDHIGDAVTLSIASNSLINLNFTGTPDTLRSLIVGGIGQLPGLYGSAASGAPHQLPQFAGTGKVLAKMLAVSRKTHGAAGDFDINLPFGGAPGIECRSGGANGNYQIVVTFVNPVTFDSAVISGDGMVSSTTGNGTTVVTVNLTAVTNQQRIYVELNNVNDGATTETIPIPMGILIGDTNSDGVVNSGDSTQTKNRAGQPTNATNFRSDITTDGVINSGDSFLVKSRAGTSLP